MKSNSADMQKEDKVCRVVKRKREKRSQSTRERSAFTRTGIRRKRDKVKYILKRETFISNGGQRPFG